MHSIAKLVIGYSDYFTNSNPFFLKKLVFVITGPIEMNLEKINQSKIQCIATGARPTPNFKWYIADELLENITVTESKEDVEDGKANYMSTFDYTGQPKDVAQMLKCEVIHPGYDNADRQDGINLAKAQLKLRLEHIIFLKFTI